MDSNLFWCIVGIIGGAISSFLISLFFYLKGFKNKKILFSEVFSFIPIVKEILFLMAYALWGVNVKTNHKYKNVTYFKIKAVGKEVIEMKNFTDSSPFRIHFNSEYETTINNAKIGIASSNSENKIGYTIKDNDILLNFDCLEKGDTIQICILSPDDVYPRLKGHLKGGQITCVGISFLLYFTLQIIKIIFLSLLFLIIVGSVLNFVSYLQTL